MELKPGYKQTEVGVVPDDWEVLTTADLVVPTAPICYGVVQVGQDTNGGVPIVAIKYVKDIASSPLHRTSAMLERPYARSRIKGGDVLISIKGTIGRVGVVPEGFEGNISRELARLRVKPNYSAEYLAQQLETDGTQNRILKSVVGTTRLEFSIATLRKFELAVPKNRQEQVAIAETLNDVDRLLFGLDRLIAKKRDLKQAAMQQLLTEQTRLPGFHSDWAEKLFGEITTPRKERVDPRRDGVRDFCVELEHLESRTGNLIGSISTGENASLKSVFREGDVLFGKLRAYLRKYWLADRSGVCSTEIWVFAPNVRLVTSGYLFQLVKIDRFIEAAITAYGTHMPRSDWNVVKNYKLRLPSIAEQIAIAEVLNDMDAELAVLVERREKTRAIKQAMTQELLTGETRLIQPHEAYA